MAKLRKGRKKMMGASLRMLSMAAGMAAIAVLGMAGCHSRTASRKPTAVATIFAYYDAMRAIGGDDIDSVILLPPGQSPHGYEPTVADRAKVAKAAVVIKNGLLIDAWADKLLAGNKSAVVIDVGELIKDKGIRPLEAQEVSVTPQESDSTSRDRKGADASDKEPADVSAGNPHIWLDPAVQAMAAEAIRDALIKIDPVHSQGYEQRAKAYVEELRKLDEDFAAAVKGFKEKEFIGFHLAYSYLAMRYGLNQVAAVEELPAQGPSLAQQANIIKLIRDKHISVIFMETALPAKAADRIIQETGVKAGILQPLETYDNPGQTYISLMRENLAALKDAMK
jgi:zinc transport system substrate-binding protein